MNFSVSAVCANKPKGYKVVTNPNVPNPAGSQTRASVSCPKKHEVLSGGAYSLSGYTSVNLNSSYPSGTRKWTVAMNNASSQYSVVSVYAVCGEKVHGYQQVSTAPISNPAGSQTRVLGDCPTGKLAVGGGVYSDRTSLDVNIGNTFPDSHSAEWYVWENNASGSNSSMIVYSVCA